jgi:hypothetical protein
MTLLPAAAADPLFPGHLFGRHSCPENAADVTQIWAHVNAVFVVIVISDPVSRGFGCLFDFVVRFAG